MAAGPGPGGKRPYDHLIKLLLNGDPGVGKSSLLMRFADDTFEESGVTQQTDFKMRTIEMDEKKIKLQVWDTAGQEKFRTITTAYYRGAQGILIVFSYDNLKSFENVRVWVNNIGEQCPEAVTILVANKSDIDDDDREVTKEQGEALAEELNIQWFETSAKTGSNVEDAFITLSREVKKKIIDRVETDSDEENLDEEMMDYEEGDQNKKKRKQCILL